MEELSSDLLGPNPETEMDVDCPRQSLGDGPVTQTGGTGHSLDRRIGKGRTEKQAVGQGVEPSSSRSPQACQALTMVSGALVLVRSSAGKGGGGLLRAVGAHVSGGGGGAGVVGCPSSSDSGAAVSRGVPGSEDCRGAEPGRPGAPASKEPTGMLAMAAFTFWGALGVGRWALGATKL